MDVGLHFADIAFVSTDRFLETMGLYNGTILFDFKSEIFIRNYLL